MTRILGLSGYYHDSAAALVEDGELVRAAQEERFTRIKHDPQFPSNATQFCLANESIESIDYIVFYDKPLLKFERLLETQLAFAPLGLGQFTRSMQSWLGEKLFLKQRIRLELTNLTGCPQKKLPQLLFTQHHESHAGSAFYCSPFKDAAVLCIDGVGEWATTSAWRGSEDGIKGLWQINFPHSIGLLYSAFTYFCGFKVNDGEYKLMGLAPFGTPEYVDVIRKELIDIKADGSFRLNLDYFNYCVGETMTSEKFATLFGGQRRSPDVAIRQLDMDLAASVQVVIEDVIIKLATSLKAETGLDNLCLAGGVALNCVANGELRRRNIFDNVWAQPAAGDAGGAVGAAFCAWHQYLGHKKGTSQEDAMKGCLLGPTYQPEEIQALLDDVGAHYRHQPDNNLYKDVAQWLDDGDVVGWFQGAMEFGPRALGARSILGDARSPLMQKRINTRIKSRESFRPFAPVVLEDDANLYFEMDKESPYMMFVEKVLPSLRTQAADTLPIGNLQQGEPAEFQGLQKVNAVRSSLPAITHLDYSARVQTVSPDRAPFLHDLLEAFKDRTGCSVLINTSFNVRGEPIVGSPLDAYKCFMSTDMDCLVLGNYVLKKQDQKQKQKQNQNQSQEHQTKNQTDTPAVSVPELKQFSRSLAITLCLLFGLLFPFLLGKNFPLWPWAIGLLLLAWGELVPQSLRPFHHFWFKLGHQLSRITSPILLGIVYITVLTPTAILKRWFAKPVLALKKDVNIKSYKEDYQPNLDMRDPF